MDRARIGELLQPFLPGIEIPPQLLDQLQIYLDLLLRWNARVNLTAVRDPEPIVMRHFGESLFAAQMLARHSGFLQATTLADVGSGAGFPGIPIKLLLPQVRLTLIESQNKKGTFLREAIRALDLENAEVFCGRAEQWEQTAGVVTLRAVEQFARALPVAASLVGEQGLLGLLIGREQFEIARKLTPGEWKWSDPVAIPNSAARVVAVAARLT
ncbi:MAG TPA: 16S rRNA (guanine(527)-N(7))-methyltransferase RsmG [Bryocella sp.]|nr:16S rRNA (guanine(527)-N(7))-methyltransferase RsmG [Bryocella sp.]